MYVRTPFLRIAAIIRHVQFPGQKKVVQILSHGNNPEVPFSLVFQLHQIIHFTGDGAVHFEKDPLQTGFRRSVKPVFFLLIDGKFHGLKDQTNDGVSVKQLGFAVEPLMPVWQE